MHARSALAVLFVVGALAGPAAFAQQSPSASAPAGDAARGKQLFADNCSACHGGAGEGGVGPALKDAAKRLTAAQVTAQIENPAPPMPKLYPGALSDKDVADV